MPPDALRDQIAAIVGASMGQGVLCTTVADAILALVRKHATSDAAVERAKKAQYRVSGHMGSDTSMRAAIVDALAISQDHQRGALRQLKDMRSTMRYAAMEVATLRGQKPHA